jgi:hypothetical protein
MTHEKLNLGQQLGRTRSIPEYIQVAISFGAMAAWLILLGLGVAPFFVVFVGAMIGAVGVYIAMFYIPALRSTLTIYERGLELVVQGKTSAFAYDQLTCLEAKFKHHELNHNYIGTLATLSFSVEGRYSPYTYECEFRQGLRSEQMVLLAIDLCSQAIQRRLLADLEREGVVRWRDNVVLTPEGLLLIDSADDSRLVPYRQIGAFKVADNQLRIWKTDAALPFLVLANDTPNFVPILGLFESLCTASRSVEAAQPASVRR